MRGGLLVGCLVLIAGCASLRPGTGVPPAPLADTDLATWEWRGVARGPLGALGPRAEVHVFLRADAAIRAEIRYAPDDGPPVHEILIWDEPTALLFEARSLSSTPLGDTPGRVDALGASFRPADAVWLLTGRQVHPASGMQWQTRDGTWRGRAADRGWRRPRAEPVAWTELVWRSDGRVHTLRATVEAHDGAAGLPRTLRLEGAALEAPIVLDADFVHMHAAMGDSILDPTWEPEAR